MIASVRNSRLGFSLIELLVTVTVMGIVAAAGTPALLRYLHDHQVLGWAENFAADMRLCRQRATAQGNDFVFSWNTETRTYTLFDDRNNNGVREDGEEQIGPKQLPEGVTITNGPDNPFAGSSVTFSPNGSATESGEITLSNAENLTRVVELIRPTALVRVR